MPWGGARGQNLEHLRFFFSFTFFFLVWNYSYLNHLYKFEQKALYRADFLSVTSDYRVQCARVGRGVKI